LWPSISSRAYQTKPQQTRCNRSLEAIAPKVQIGTHSMRKNRGYAMHKTGRSIEEICKILNYSHPAITMRYIGLTQEQIDQSYIDFEL